jgi:hypothetical protein
MNIREWPFVLLFAVPLLLTGCAAVDVSAGQGTPIASMSPAMSMAPGQTMPGMSSTPATPPAEAIATGDTPSKSAQMICGTETRANIATLLALTSPPAAKATWADHIYTCTYQLAVGALVLSVTESADLPKARIYFDALRVHLGNTKPLAGMASLGFPAYETTTGTVVFLKDNKTLEVNASALPARVGPEGSSPADFAYTIATDVLACWSDK